MALLQYLKPAKDCLPDPKGALAGSVPSRTILAFILVRNFVELSIQKYPCYNNFVQCLFYEIKTPRMLLTWHSELFQTTVNTLT